MPPLTPRVVIETVAAIGTVCSLFFYFLSTLGLASFLGDKSKKDRNKKLKHAPLPESELPPVSILKPLKGVDPQVWESFCSHCEQDYPQFQLIYGVSDLWPTESHQLHTSARLSILPLDMAPSSNLSCLYNSLASH